MTNEASFEYDFFTNSLHIFFLSIYVFRPLAYDKYDTFIWILEEKKKDGNNSNLCCFVMKIFHPKPVIKSGAKLDKFMWSVFIQTQNWKKNKNKAQSHTSTEYD